MGQGLSRIRKVTAPNRRPLRLSGTHRQPHGLGRCAAGQLDGQSEVSGVGHLHPEHVIRWYVSRMHPLGVGVPHPGETRKRTGRMASWSPRVAGRRPPMACTLAVLPQRSSTPTTSAGDLPVYRPRRAEASPLWRLVAKHADSFLEAYDERYAGRYGTLRPVVSRALEGFQRCGILAWGFARVRCPDCRHEYLLAFSCKQRCLCPSCHSKRQAAFGAFVTEEILAAVPHRHVVLSLPRYLRPFCRCTHAAGRGALHGPPADHAGADARDGDRHRLLPVARGMADCNRG